MPGGWTVGASLASSRKKTSYSRNAANSEESAPDSLREQLAGGGFSPAPVGRRTGRTRMKYLADTYRRLFQGLSGARLGKTADPDNPFRFQRHHKLPEMLVASRIQRLGLGNGQLVRSQIAAKIKKTPAGNSWLQSDLQKRLRPRQSVAGKIPITYAR